MEKVKTVQEKVAQSLERSRKQLVALEDKLNEVPAEKRPHYEAAKSAIERQIEYFRSKQGEPPKRET